MGGGGSVMAQSAITQLAALRQAQGKEAASSEY